jgi:hypothetical protein
LTTTPSMTRRRRATSCFRWLMSSSMSSMAHDSSPSSTSARATTRCDAPGGR